MKKNNVNLYVWRSGLAVISVGKVPEGAIKVARGDKDILESCLVAGCRWSCGGGGYYVNGISPSVDSDDAIDALVAFSAGVKRKLKGEEFFEVPRS